MEHEEADAVRARLHLADHHQDQGQRERRAHPRKDPRAGGRQHDSKQAPAAAEAVDAGRVDERRVEPADPVDRVEQDRPDTARGDHGHLHGRADSDCQNGQRDQERRRDGAHELDDRLDQVADDAGRAKQEPAAHSQHQSQQVAEGHSLQAGQHVRGEPPEEPGLAEGPQDVRQRRKEEAAGARGPDPPTQQNGKRHGRLEREPRGTPQTASLCDGCQRSTLASRLVKAELRTSPSRPATMIRPYIRA